MVRLQAPNTPDSFTAQITKNVKKYSRKSTKAIMRSHHFRIPVYDMPIRIRPWFLLFTSIVMVLLGLLSFTKFAKALPLNDKLLRFVCLGTATGVFYFIFDVEEDARRIWFWRQSPLIFTGAICFFLGGIVSEIVQSMLPSNEFRIGDVIANLLGSSLGLYISYYLEKYYRHRREISRLYRPLDTEIVSSDEEEEGENDTGGTQLLPTHAHQNQSKPASTNKAGGAIRLADVWDEREEVFDIGPDSDEEEPENRGPNVARDT